MTMAADTTGSLPLQLSDDGIHDAMLRALGKGVYEVQTTGPDPYVFTESLAQPLDPRRQHVLAFDYFSTRGTDRLQVFLDPPVDEAHSVTGEGLGVSEGWSPHAIDLKPALDMVGGKLRRLRIDFGSRAGRTVQLRSLRLRPPTSQELAAAARRAQQREYEARLETRQRDYLRRDYPCRVTRVSVDDQRITVEGEVGSERGDLFLAEAPMHEDVTETSRFPTLEPIRPDSKGRFTLGLDRQRRQGGRERDRLLSRWAVVRRSGDGFELRSHARYPDAVQAEVDLPEERPRGRKGLGALWVSRPMSDLDELGIAGVTVNIRLNSLVHTTPGPGRTPFQYAGREWHSDNGYVEQVDQTLLEAARRRIIVSVIILISQAGDAPDGSWGRLAAHPDADPAGIYVMPNVSDEEGLDAYAAALDFLAQRYSRPDNRYGRIHHWIMHNEVNAGWVWTNAGEKTALRYMDLYHKSMRAAHLIARRYNPHAKVFISLEHHWTMKPTPKFYAGRELLDLLLEFSRAEGDFDWAIAHHPYPEDLRDPRVWEDTEATFTFDTPKITFKNLEVLDAWVKQPRTFFLGKARRTVHLTEQGLNSPDYSELSLQRQAAGMAYAWQKIKPLKSIELFHYHNWADNRGEGGLRIGLRRFPDDEAEPHGKKPIWFVYQALDTEREEEATAFARHVVGVKEWSEIRHQRAIAGPRGERPS